MTVRGSALAALALLVVPAGASRADPGVLDQIMARLAAAPSRETRFVADKHVAALAQPVHSAGRMLYRKPDHLEQITQTPQPERLVIDGGSVSISSPGQPTRRLGLDDSPALRILADTLLGAVSGNRAALARHFRIAEQGPLQAWRITLTPAGNVTAQVVRIAYIDGDGAEVRQIDIVQANGDETRITLQP